MSAPIIFAAMFGLLVAQAVLPFAIDFIASIAIGALGFYLGKTISKS